MTRAIVRVRPAEPADAEAVATLIRSAEARTTPSAPAGSDTPPLDERVRTLLADERRVFLVAVDDEGEVAGLLAAIHDAVGALDLTPVLSVTHLIVRPGERRRGAGRALLAAAVQLAEQAGVDHLVADVAAGSREGNRYLARIGFAPLVVSRIAPVAVLRRSLGMHDAGNRTAVLRRARMLRAQRLAVAAGRRPR